MAFAQTGLLVLTVSLALCVSVLGQSRTREEDEGNSEEPQRYRSYNFQSYRVESLRSYDDYDDSVPDYEDDPHLENTKCNYTQADHCRTHGFTNLTNMNQAGVCQARQHKIGQDEYTHECLLSERNARVNYCCCQFFEEAQYANYTLLMCCKRTTGQHGQYACNNFWNTVDQLNEYGDDYGGGTGCRLAIHLLTLLTCVLLTTSWKNCGLSAQWWSALRATSS